MWTTTQKEEEFVGASTRSIHKLLLAASQALHLKPRLHVSTVCAMVEFVHTSQGS